MRRKLFQIELPLPEAQRPAQRPRYLGVHPLPPQEPCDVGLFSDDRLQVDLVDEAHSQALAKQIGAATAAEKKNTQSA